MSARFFTLPRFAVFDTDTGDPLESGKVYFWDNGTQTLKTIYSDYARTVEATNPVTLDSRGEGLAVLGSGFYTIEVREADDSTVVYNEDDISANDTVSFVYPENYGALRDGTTDDTVALQAAIDSGEPVWLSKGTYLTQTLSLANNTIIIGSGVTASKLSLADNTDNAVLQFPGLADDFRGIWLQNFQIYGNKANQTEATLTRGIYLENSGGTSSNLARHNIHNIFVQECKSDGLLLGSYMRSSHVSHVDTYKCDGYGIYLKSFSDTKVHHCDVGQSGLEGFYANGCGTMHLSDCKSWYSGQTNDGAGFKIRNSSIIGFGLESQENNGGAFDIETDDAVARPLVLHGLTSDADNVSATASTAALALTGVKAGTIDLTVVSIAAAGGDVDYGVSADTNSQDFEINLRIDDAITGLISQVTGAGINKGEVKVNGVTLERIKTLANDATPSVQSGRTFLTGGTTTITDFDDGAVGQVIQVIAEHAITITDGTNIFLNASANYVMGATDTLTLIQKADGLWYELSRSNN